MSVGLIYISYPIVFDMFVIIKNRFTGNNVKAFFFFFFFFVGVFYFFFFRLRSPTRKLKNINVIAKG